MRASLPALALLTLTACRTAPPPGLDLAAAEVVDLSHAFDEKTIYWPNAPSTFRLEQLSFGLTPGGFFYASNSFCSPEHGGTHLDAPIHFAAQGQRADQIPVRRLIAPAVVIDVAAQATADSDYRLSRDDVLAWELRHGAVPTGSIVLLRTGWSGRWPDRKSYLGDDTPGETSKLHFPAYGEEAARYLIEERRVGALGLDTASLDHGPARDFPVHRLAAAANVPGLENLTGLDRLPPTGAWVVALPMKIRNGTGGPLRAIALLPPGR
ncbi:MAG TPA: cyclase family protein [Kofleriaceae bacterium]